MAQEIEQRGEQPDAATLDAIQANALSQLAAAEAGIQALEAHRTRLLAALGHLALHRAGGSSDRMGMELRAIAAEVGAASQVSDRTVQRHIGDAMSLADTWPSVLDAYAEARIGRGHVRAITEAGAVLVHSDVTDEQRSAFATSMVALAESTTPERVSKVARREADAHVTEPATVRHRAAREDRCVRVTDVDDGMSWFGALVPSVLAHGIEHRLRAGARGKPKDDTRTMAQWMADAFCQLLLTAEGPTHAASDDVFATGPQCGRPGLLVDLKPVVQITIPATTITGVTTTSGVLDGAQAVDADLARALAGDAPTWERLFLDPVRGTVVEVDTYTPTAAQRRMLSARDQHCRFSGCCAKSRDDDLDHTIAWEEGGPTNLGNLAHLCRRHHTLKHATAWTVSQPIPGVLRWTSPLGRVYLDEPPPVGPTVAEERPPPGADAVDFELGWGAPTDPDADHPF